MPPGIVVFLGYAFLILGLIGLSLRYVIDQAISAPVSLPGVVVMVLLAYTIFTVTLVLQRKEAARGLALGLTSLTIPGILLLLAAGLPLYAGLVALLAADPVPRPDATGRPRLAERALNASARCRRRPRRTIPSAAMRQPRYPLRCIRAAVARSRAATAFPYEADAWPRHRAGTAAPPAGPPARPARLADRLDRRPPTPTGRPPTTSGAGPSHSPTGTPRAGRRQRDRFTPPKKSWAQRHRGADPRGRPAARLRCRRGVRLPVDHLAVVRLLDDLAAADA